jgi:hypothetical protein
MASKIINGIEYANFPEEELAKISGMVDLPPLARDLAKIAGNSASLPAVRKLIDATAGVERRLNKSGGLSKAAVDFVDGRFDVVDAELKKIAASDARELLKRAAVDADPELRQRLRVMGEGEAYAKRDR